MSAQTIDYLIRVLQDKSIDLGVRDDAAMDLGDYDEPRVLEALIQAAIDLEEEEMVLDSCGTSIMEYGQEKAITIPLCGASSPQLQKVRAMLQTCQKGANRSSTRRCI